jgi:calcium permeable stress-gated cation channel
VVRGIIQGILPPVLFAVVFMLLPIFLRLIIKLQGETRQSEIERKVSSNIGELHRHNK